MNRQNFNPEEVGNYPLTIERMAEMQEDQQLALRVLAEMCGGQNCILAGCESPGSAGYVLVNGEVLEVKAAEIALVSLHFLTLRSRTTTATNSEGETVTVREERWMEWTQGMLLGGGVSIGWAGLPRLLPTMSNGGMWRRKTNGAWENTLKMLTTTRDEGMWVRSCDGNWLQATDGEWQLFENYSAFTADTEDKLPRARKLANGMVEVAGEFTKNSQTVGLLMLPQGFRIEGAIPIVLSVRNVASSDWEITHQTLMENVILWTAGSVGTKYKMHFFYDQRLLKYLT